MFKAKKIEIDAAHNLICVLLDCDANELGLNADERVRVYTDEKFQAICDLEILDTKNISLKHRDLKLKKGEIGLFEVAFEKLNIWEDKKINISPAKKPSSLKYVEKKFKGGKLLKHEYLDIMIDIVENRFTEVETTYFVLACTINKLDDDETVFLTEAMVNVGKQLDFKTHKKDVIVDKHCIGGVPNNRTTMIVVPIVAAAGLKIPKTSSRAITSPAGTADTMEVLANVEVKVDKMYSMVEDLGGCIIWGGSLDLSPADDIIIQVEHPLQLDSEEQMIASILSKKKSAGSTHVLIDIPIGKTAKIQDKKKAERLGLRFLKVGRRIGLVVRVLITDGKEPIGSGIGPLHEARDVIAVLNCENCAPQDLRHKGLLLAGNIFEIAGFVREGEGYELARHILESGKAFDKFEEIIEAQGRAKPISEAKFSEKVITKKKGSVKEINNKFISKLAYILGAPNDKAAGLVMRKKVGDKVMKGDILYEIYSNSELKLKYGLNFLKENKIYLIK